MKTEKFGSMKTKIKIFNKSIYFLIIIIDIFSINCSTMNAINKNRNMGNKLFYETGIAQNNGEYRQSIEYFTKAIINPAIK